MGLANPQLHFTTEEYLDLERKSEQRNQFVDGQIFAMAGESLEHSTICCNLTASLVDQLRGRNCRTLSPNMKIRSGLSHGQRSGMFSYADATVVCGEPRFHDDKHDVLLNPRVIFEVLSPSTEAFDRGEKFLRYRTHLDTLTDYLLLSADKPLVEHFRRQTDGHWLYYSVDGLHAILQISSIECVLKLAEIYGRVDFQPQP